MRHGANVKKVNIAVIEYPGASKSAVYGFVETIELTNTICQRLHVSIQFVAKVSQLETLDNNKAVDVVVLPPGAKDEFYAHDNHVLNQYLSSMQRNGATLASACVGAFILARGGFLDNKFCTTHWRLASIFATSFPKAKLNEHAIIVNEGSVITAGGRMAWLDLAFEVISTYCAPSVAVALSKEMVVDTGYREQRFYRQFVPRLDHGDELIERVQAALNEQYSQTVTVSALADSLYVSNRTLQRRFLKATGLSIIEYLQKLRLNHACQLIELTQKTISEISFLVGYQNVSAFRKVFFREYGLSPLEFRKRFSLSARSE